MMFEEHAAPYCLPLLLFVHLNFSGASIEIIRSTSKVSWRR